MSMLIIMPSQGQFTNFEQALTSEKIAAILSSMQPAQVKLGMPKFTFESSFTMAEILKAMGMLDAFSPTAADFSGITGSPFLFISDVDHKSFVKVDEKGTEAAAATAVVFCGTSVPPEPVEMTLDKPFIFLIRDKATSAIIFVGRFVEP